MTDARGIVVGYLLTAGHVHNTKGLAFLLTDLQQIELLLERAITLLGDKGYVGAEAGAATQTRIWRRVVGDAA